MSVTVTIPVIEDYREVITTGFDNITSIIPVGNYLFACGYGAASIGQLLRINKGDFADRSILTFPTDGIHKEPYDLCHSAGFVYVFFRNIFAQFMVIAKVNTVGAMVSTVFANESNVTPGPGSITTDDAFIYAVTNSNPAKLLRWNIDGTNFQSVNLPGANTYGRCIRHAGGKLYVTGGVSAQTGWILRASSALSVEQSTTTFDTIAGETSVDKHGLSADHVWVGNNDTAGIIKKFSKSNLASVTNLTTGQLSVCTSVDSDGRDIWALFENGRAVRFNPSTNEQRIYTLNDGQGFQSELTGDSIYLFGAFPSVPAKITRHHIPSDAGGSKIWAIKLGCTADGSSAAGVTDTGGNLYVGSACGPRPVTAFLNKLSSTGTPVGGNWPIGVGPGATGTFILATAIANDGHVLCTGYFTGTVNFGDGDITAVGGSEIFVVKYDSTTAALIWKKTYGNAAGGLIPNKSGLGIAVHPSDGTILVVGTFDSVIDFTGNGTGTPGTSIWTSAGNRDGFILKLNSNGSHNRSMRLGNTLDADSIGGVVVDSSGNVYVIGVFQGTVDFGGSLLNSGGGVGIYLLKLNSSFAQQWVKIIGSHSGFNRGNGIAIDLNGNPIITGSFSLGFGDTEVDFNQGASPAAPKVPSGGDIFIAKYNQTNGALIWARQGGGSADPNQLDVGYTVSVDRNDNVLAVCIGFGSGSFEGGETLPAIGSFSDVWLVKYDTNGAHIWSQNFGSHRQETKAVGWLSGDDLLVTGKFEAPLTFKDGSTLTPTPGGFIPSDVYVVKFSA